MNNEIKEFIISTLNLEDIKPSDIEDDMPLFGAEGLGLDSVDALELALNLQKVYAITLDNKTDNVKEIFFSAKSLGKYIEENRRDNE